MFGARQKHKPAISSNTLTGSRVFLRPPVIADYKSWADVRSNNRDHLQPFEPRWDHDSLVRDHFERRILRQYLNWREGIGCYFLIFKNDDETLVGGMNVNQICRGIWQGYMSEAINLTLKYCFEDLKLHRVNAACVPHNSRSMNLIRRAGFTEEGFARKYLEINGEWQDHVLFGLLREDREKLKLPRQI